MIAQEWRRIPTGIQGKSTDIQRNIQPLPQGRKNLKNKKVVELFPRP